MKDIEYKISLDGGNYYDVVDISINLSTERDNYDVLTDNEVLTTVADSIIHEYIHYILHREFNLTVSKLFDTIGHLFYIDYSLLEKHLFQTQHTSTWKDIIKKLGIGVLYANYGISHQNLMHARYLCNYKEV